MQNEVKGVSKNKEKSKKSRKDAHIKESNKLKNDVSNNSKDPKNSDERKSKSHLNIEEEEKYFIKSGQSNNKPLDYDSELKDIDDAICYLTKKYQMKSQLKDLNKLYKKFKKKEVTKDGINSMYYEIRETYRAIDTAAYLKIKLREASDESVVKQLSFDYRFQDSCDHCDEYEERSEKTNDSLSNIFEHTLESNNSITKNINNPKLNKDIKSLIRKQEKLNGSQVDVREDDRVNLAKFEEEGKANKVHKTVVKNSNNVDKDNKLAKFINK